MAMSKQDFIALADAVKSHNEYTANDSNLTKFDQEHIITLADFCESQNPRFNRDRWLDYIAGKRGPNGGKVGA